MFKHLGRFTAAYPACICVAWLAVAVAVAVLAPTWDGRAQDDDIRFLPERCPSVRGHRLLERAFPQDLCASRLLLVLEREHETLRPGDLTLADDLATDLAVLAQAEPGLQLGKIASPGDPLIGNRLVSDDRHCALVQVSLSTPYLALQTRAAVDRVVAVAQQRLDPLGAEAPSFHASGPAGFGRDLTAAAADSLEGTTLATIGLVIVILLAVYRAPLLALVPLVTLGVSVFVALKVLALCTLVPGFYLVNVSQVFAVVMLYGAGTDYCLFLIARYREELAAGHGPRVAVARSVGAVGAALAASAGTVICGLGLMVLAEFAKVRCAGPAIAIGLAVALAGSLTLTPALLRVLGRHAFWPGTGPRRELGLRRPTLWDHLSAAVVARPVLVLVVAVVPLLPLALLGATCQPSYRATGELSPQSASVRGLDAIQRHFTAGEVGPITVLLDAPTPWDTAEGQQLLIHLTQGFARLDNVSEVRSLVQPLGKPLAEAMAYPPGATRWQSLWQKVVRGVNDQVMQQAKPFYCAEISGNDGKPRYIARLDVVPFTDPFAPRSAETLELLQIWLNDQLPRSGALAQFVRPEVFGVTVSARDLATVTEADRLRIDAFVVLGVFAILLLLVRRPWLAAYLLATVLFSYLATLGATTLFAHLVHGRPMGMVDWRVPFFLFTILVAVGEDYNILLIDRMLHERKRHGPLEGTRRALAHTGGTITSCGVIMAGTFATLMLGGLSTLVQIGFALAFGVLLDTFVVRPFLVPALAVVVWRRGEARMLLPLPTRSPTQPLRLTPAAPWRRAG